MLDGMTITEIIKLIAPLIIIELILIVTSIVTLVKTEPNYLPKWIWLLIILFVNPLGPIAYLIFGRKRV